MKFKRSNLEKQILNLPSKVLWCKNCVYSNQRPKIIFNKDGICSGCTNAHRKNNDIDWKKREKELRKLLNKYRSKNGSWDVIVPSSGGKDSGFVAHQLKHKYGMNPLSVTWSPLQHTDIGFKNFQSKIKSGFTNILYSPNGNFQRRLARLCFEQLGDAFHVFVLGQHNFPFHMALKFNIKLIFYGENGSAEYADDPMGADMPYHPTSQFVHQYFKGVTFEKLLKFGIENTNYLTKKYFTDSELEFYKIPKISKLKKAKIIGKYFYSYFHKWNPQENFYYCSDNTGFKANPERTEGTYSKYASLDDKMDGFHYYMRYIKFGLGRCTEDASQEIRNGYLTREEALLLMKKYEGEFPKKYFKDFLEYLNITEKHFWKIVDSWRSKYLWKKINNKWKLKYPAK